MAEVDELRAAQHEALLLEELGEAELACVQRAAKLRQRRRARAVDRDALLVLGEQDAGLLEALAQRRDPVGEAARLQPEPGARLGVGHARHAAQRAQVAVGLVERAARKHVRAREERRAAGPLQHERLGAEAAVAQQQQRGGGTGNELVGHPGQALRPARSLSFCALIRSRARCQSPSDILSSSVK